MNKRIVAGFLLFCLFVMPIQTFALAEALEQDRYEDWIWEPYVEEDASLSTGQATLWACVTFGSYPQTEIVPGAFTAVDDYAVQEGDYLEERTCMAGWPERNGKTTRRRSAESVICA